MAATMTVNQKGGCVELITIQDLADILKCSKSFLYKKLQKGELPHIRIGAMYRFTKENVTEILKAAARGELRTRKPPTPGFRKHRPRGGVTRGDRGSRISGAPKVDGNG